MSDLFLVLFFVSFVCLIVGLVKPDIFSRFIKKELTRKNIGLIFGVAMIIFFVLIGATHTPREVLQPEPQSEKTIEPIIEEIGEIEKEVLYTEPEATPEPEITTQQPAQQPQQTGASLLPARTEADAIIRKNADDKWGDNYRMVKYEIDKQTKAYNWLIRQSNYLSVMERAINKWKDNYTMVKYEYDKQVEAYKSL